MESRLASIVDSRRFEAQAEQIVLAHDYSEWRRGSTNDVAAGRTVSPETVDGWIHSGRYDDVLLHWVNGGAVDWTRFYPRGFPNRMRLPGYPFAKERYWIPEAAADQPGSSPLESRAGSADRGVVDRTATDQRAGARDT
jgi:hypothetical protein